MSTPTFQTDPDRARRTAQAVARMAGRPFVNPVKAALEKKRLPQADLARALEIGKDGPNIVCHWTRWTPERPTRLPQERYHAQIEALLGIPAETWEQLRALARMMRTDDPRPAPKRAAVKRARAATKPRRPAKPRAKQAAAPVEAAPEPVVVLDADVPVDPAA